MKSSAWSGGKFIVSGEHAVIYGAPCLVYPLKSARTHIHYAQIHLEKPSSSDNSLPFRLIWNGQKLNAFQENLIDLCLKEIGFRDFAHSAFELRVESNIPIGSGLGSSAAFCVALARLLPITEENEVFERAFRGERVFHGNPSGADPACVLQEKPIVYTRDPRTLQPFEAGGSTDLFWVLRDSKETHSTTRVIEGLKKLEKETFTKNIESLTRSSAVLIEQLRLSSEKRGDSSSLKSVQKEIEEICEIHRQMNLLTPFVEETLYSLKKEGALAAKMTGAGCGGYVMALFDKDSLQRRYLPRATDYVVTLSGDDISTDQNFFAKLRR